MLISWNLAQAEWHIIFIAIRCAPLLSENIRTEFGAKWLFKSRCIRIIVCWILWSAKVWQTRWLIPVQEIWWVSCHKRTGLARHTQMYRETIRCRVWQIIWWLLLPWESMDLRRWLKNFNWRNILNREMLHFIHWWSPQIRYRLRIHAALNKGTGWESVDNLVGWEVVKLWEVDSFLGGRWFCWYCNGTPAMTVTGHSHYQVQHQIWLDTRGLSKWTPFRRPQKYENQVACLQSCWDGCTDLFVGILQAVHCMEIYTSAPWHSLELLNILSVTAMHSFEHGWMG